MRADVRRMCFVTGPSFTSCNRKNGRTIRAVAQGRDRHDMDEQHVWG